MRQSSRDPTDGGPSERRRREEAEGACRRVVGLGGAALGTLASAAAALVYDGMDL